MSNGSGVLGFVAGALVGAAAGVVAGILIAPRPGSETRAMAADVAADAWGNVVDVYQQSADEVAAKVDTAFEETQSKTEELRAKVESARERMDQIRASLVNNVSQAAENIHVDVDIEDVTPEEVPQEPTSWTVHMSNND